MNNSVNEQKFSRIIFSFNVQSSVNEQTKKATKGGNRFPRWQTESVAVVDDVISLNKSMDLEINNTDFEEQVKEHIIELSIYELQLL